jgi:hypothetical protein
VPLAQLPPEQAQFVSVIESFYQPYNDAPNELRRSTLRADRRNALEKALPSRAVQGWMGQIKEMTTTTEGKAHLAVRLGGSKSIVVQTWNNTLSDVFDRTLIDHGSALYNSISRLSRGDVIRFGGNFFSGSNALDFLEEKSMTESGSMTEPEFIFRFTSVEKRP